MNELTDPFGLRANHQDLKLVFGETRVLGGMRGGRLHTSLESVATADFGLDPDRLGIDLPDFLAPLSVYAGRRIDDHPVFQGHVRRAAADERGVIQVYAADSSELTETVLGGLRTPHLPPMEAVYILARGAGLAPQQLVIEGLDDLPTETFEVLAPLEGLQVADRVSLGSVTLLPPEPVAARLLVEGFDDTRLHGASGYALALQTEQLAFDAEQRGLDEIDAVLGWVTARQRYGLALLRDGTPQAFDRDDARALPVRRDVVAVRGLLTGRRYSRAPSLQARAATLRLDAADPLLQSVDVSMLSVTDRLALNAARRAVSISEPLERIQALWEATEYLVAGVRAPKTVTREQIKQLKDNVPSEMDDGVRRRALKAIDGMNQVPLLARLRFMIESSNLPCSEEEIELLSEMRRVRNDVAHGRLAQPPTAERLDYATAVVCRLIVSRLVTTTPTS